MFAPVDSLFFGRNQPSANRESHQARDIVDLQSAHQLEPMRLDRLDADPEQRGNFLCRLPFGDALQYFPLPKRELFQFWINVSRLFFCRSYVRYLDPLPDSISNRNCELMCARRVENLLGPAPCQRKCTGGDHPLVFQEILDLLLELAKAT